MIDLVDEGKIALTPAEKSAYLKEEEQRDLAELSTGREEDFQFTLLNTTNSDATVLIELFFEESFQKIRYIRTSVEAGAIRRVNIVGKEVNSEWVYFNWLSLKAQGIPENAPFAVRFMSEIPIVVSHRDHTAAYRSTIQ